MESTLEHITPEVASRYLERNCCNRKIRERDVNALCRDIKNGNIVLTHQGIAFDAEGNLIDGQHRLTACVKAGVPIDVLVTRGIEFKNAGFVDVGIKRNLQDSFVFSGKYKDSPAFRNTATAGAVRKLVLFGYSQSFVLSNSEMQTLFDAFHDELESLYKASTCRKSSSASVNAGALSALLCGETADDIYKWFSVFLHVDSTDCEDYNIASPYNLSRQIMEAKVKHMSIQPAVVYSLTQNSIWNFLHASSSTFIRPTKKTRYPVEKILKAILERGTGDQ